MEKKWILVVEDELEIREILVEKLRAYSESFKVVEARDGVEATAKLNNQIFDCIVTDLKMPRRTGQQFIALVKKSDRNSNTPIVVVTGHPDPDLVEAYEYVTMIEKPFRAPELIKTIEAQIRLGPTDQRIPVHLFNLLLAGLNNLFKEEFQLDYTQEKPEPKRSGEDLKGSCLLALRIKCGPTKGWIAMGFDDQAAGEFLNWKNSEFPKKAQEFGNQLLKQMQKANQKNIRLDVIEQLLLTKDKFPNYNLGTVKGVSVPYKTAKGTLYADAIIGKDTLSKKN